MVGFDTLIAKSLGETIYTNLGRKPLEKIEQRLFEKYGINLTQSIEDFEKLDSVLREFFGEGSEGLERKFLESVITLEKKQKEKNQWITLTDQSLTKLILESVGDEDKKNIINSVLDEAKITADILEWCNIPQTSGYRKINSLIQNGFLVPNGFITTHDGKRVSKYQSIFNNIRINIEKNKVVVQIRLTTESSSSSTIMQIVHRGGQQLVAVE